MKNPFRSVGNWFKKTAQQTGNFFKKDVAPAFTNIASAVGRGAGIAGNILSTVANPVSKVAGVGAGLATLAGQPELAVPLGALSVGTKAIGQAGGALSSASKGKKFNALEAGVNAGLTASKIKPV